MSDRIQKLLDDHAKLMRLIDPTGAAQLGLSVVERHAIFGLPDNAALYNANDYGLISPISDVIGATHNALYGLGLDRVGALGNYGSIESAVSEALREVAGLTATARATIDAAIGQSFYSAERFRLPELGQKDLLARAAGLRINQFGIAGDLWSESSLIQAMSAMGSPWLNALDPTNSVRAFTDIQLIGSLANSAAPYGEPASNFLRRGLGDWRDVDSADEDYGVDPTTRSLAYTKRGLDSSLTDFTPEAFDESLDTAGLPRVIDTVGPATVPVELETPNLDRNIQIYRGLLSFEIRMRAFIEETLEMQFGPKWMHTQVPPAIIALWKEKKAKALKKGEPDRALIEYADFNDYWPIIIKKDNWNKVFGMVFQRQQDIHETLHRLQPVRIQAMHARILTLDEELLMRVETTRFYNAVRLFKTSYQSE